MKGIYTADPMTDTSAEFLESITYDDVLNRSLKVMDASAISLSRDNSLPIVVFNLRTRGNILKVVTGENVGSRVHARP